MNDNHDDVITSYTHAASQTLTAGGVTYAYRELGPTGGIPVVFFVHLAATLDNWDPRIIDPIARTHHVIAFDNRGVGATTGTVPDTVESMADDAYAFITALGFTTVDILSFSLGGMVAQALVLKHPDLVRKLILTGTGEGAESTRSPAQRISTHCGPPSPVRTPRSSSSSTATTSGNEPHAPS